RVSMKTGVLASYIRFKFNQEQFSEVTEQLETVLGGQGGSTLLQGYTQFNIQAAERLIINGGVHGMFLTLNNTYSVEPRLALQYSLSENQALTLAYGLHSRVLPMGSYFTKVVDNTGQFTQPNMDLEMVKSHHTVLGYKVNLGKSLKLNVEGYYQYLFDVPVSIDKTSSYWILNERDGYATQALVSEGTGRNYGIDVSLEKFFAQDGLFFLLAGSLFDSKYTGPDGKVYNTRYNSHYSFSGMAGKEFTFENGNALELGTRVVTTGGLRYTPGDSELSKAAGEYVELPGAAFTEKIGSYFRIDARVAYRIEKAKTSYRLSIDVQNATNHKNNKDVIWDEGFNDFVTRLQSGLIPVFSFQIDF
ncbi:MAG: TonB-dependent receptor, partial [Bacteroidetes bacterium]|nr:TonB-dependent receptor [Bacteroidota bacterium]